MAHFALDGGPPRKTKKEWNPVSKAESDVPVADGGECRLLPADELARVFGTARPTRASIEADQTKLEPLFAVWEAVCVTAWDGDEPVAYFFVGTSGD